MVRRKPVKRLQQKQTGITKRQLVTAVQNYGLNQKTTLAPVAISNRIATSKPSIIANNSNQTRIRHTEYVGEIFGSVNYNVSSYTIQPGLGTLFPWLSQMATLYESYMVDKLHFHFRTEKSTSTNGVVMMAVDYDVQDSAPPSKQQLMAYNNAVRTQPWADTSYIASVADVNKLRQRFIRSGLITGADYKTFDVGNLFVATQGCADTTALGELYVSYDLVLCTPQFDLAGYAAAGSNKSSGGTGITGALILGTAPSLNIAGSGMAITYSTTTGAISFGTVGSYLINFWITQTALATGTLVPAMTGGSQVSSLTVVNTAALYTVSFTVNVINLTDALTFSGLTLTSPSASSLRVSSYPYNL